MTESLLVRSHVGRDILQSAGVFNDLSPSFLPVMRRVRVALDALISG